VLTLALSSNISDYLIDKKQEAKLSLG